VNSSQDCDPRVPFRGPKHSGIGRRLSEVGLEAYSQTKVAHIYMVTGCKGQQQRHEREQACRERLGMFLARLSWAMKATPCLCDPDHALLFCLHRVVSSISFIDLSTPSRYWAKARGWH
jgi:hypothetical protein